MGSWSLSMNGDPTGTVYPATLCNILATISMVGCSYTMGGGPLSIAGTVSGTFDTRTGKFIPTSSALSISTP
ncbi:hypothetical protein [Nocardioides sp. Iso805N]|uniref:hypothetical protein n=1 Tax=Nocardioides sp. Iso805N TaxID=1283287 RepID=UPI0012F70BCE|nr:hypothetical protein [Nocardioides sp. Iso805N]